jgi:hypothetical protein
VTGQGAIHRRICALPLTGSAWRGETSNMVNEPKPAEQPNERRGTLRALQLMVLVMALVAGMTGAGALLASRLARSGAEAAIPDLATFATQRPPLQAAEPPRRWASAPQISR